MQGQWIGTYTGSNDGTIIVNADDRGSFYSGVAFLHPSDARIPGVAASFQTVNKDQSFEFRPALAPIDPRNGLATNWDEVRALFPEGGISFEAHVTGSYDNS